MLSIWNQRDIITIQRWARFWPDVCGVLLHADGWTVNVWHEGPDGAVVDELHQEMLDRRASGASRRLLARASDVVEAGYGFYAPSIPGALVIQCEPLGASEDG